MNCELRIGGICKGKKYHGQVCGNLRPAICDQRRKLHLEIKLKRELTASAVEAEREFGIGE